MQKKIANNKQFYILRVRIAKCVKNYYLPSFRDPTACPVGKIVLT